MISDGDLVGDPILGSDAISDQRGKIIFLGMWGVRDPASPDVAQVKARIKCDKIKITNKRYPNRETRPPEDQ